MPSEPIGREYCRGFNDDQHNGCMFLLALECQISQIDIKMILGTV